MKIVLAYCYPNIGRPQYDGCARRFTEQYLKHPPGQTDHELHVMVNGPPITPEKEKLFDPLVPTFHQHDNSGRDVGAHRLAAATIPADLMVFLGAPVWPGRTGWLDVIYEAFLNHGPALYGAFCFHAPAPHVRTTCYWAPPELLNSHSLPVDDGLRYEWEHGAKSITRHVMKLGYPVLQVTWKGVYDFASWTHVEEKDCLFFDQHTERNGYGFNW